MSWKAPTGTFLKESWVKISQIRTLSTERLGAYLGRLDDEAMDEIPEGLVQPIA